MKGRIKKEPLPAKRAAQRIDKPERRSSGSLNIASGKIFSNSGNVPENTARRDAAAMVKILDKMKSGWAPYEVVYDSLKDKHGKPFEYHFREILSGRESADE